MGDRPGRGPVVVAGATGFVGRALLPALRAAGEEVRGLSRSPGPPRSDGVTWFVADARRPETLAPALRGARAVYWLVHGMGGAARDYAREERRGAAGLAREAARAGVERIVYLGGVAPQGAPSRHLASRLAVGEILRAGPVPALELRAAMIVGSGSASWKIVRDLALRLPAMAFPAWARSRSCPVALADVVRALVAALALPLPASAWFDLPGPEELSVRETLERVAALRGRRLPALAIPLPAPGLSSLWLKLVSGADFAVARELVRGLAHDLRPRDGRYWDLAGLPPRIPFDEAASGALAGDRPEPGLHGLVMAVEEALVDAVGPRGGRPRPGGRPTR